MSDPFDKDPDDLLEPDNPASQYEEGKFDTTPSTPEAPSPSSPTDIDYDQVDPELHKIFWKLVIVIKFTLISLTLGALFVTLGDRPTLGWQLLGFSAILISYGGYQYRKSKQRIEDEEFEVEQTTAENEDSDENEAENVDDAVDSSPTTTADTVLSDDDRSQSDKTQNRRQPDDSQNRRQPDDNQNHRQSEENRNRRQSGDNPAQESP